MIGLDVGEVEVDEARHEDEVRDALNRLAQDVVGRRERVEQRRGAIDGREQALVRDHDHRVHALAERLEPLLGLLRALLAFELEGLGHDGDGQRPDLIGEACDDRRGARAGAAAEPGGHEDHVGAREHFEDLVGVLERRRPADIRVGPGAEALGELRADLHLHRGGVVDERLMVGVGDDELDITETGRHHAVDGVAAAASDADDLDARARAGEVFLQEDAKLLGLTNWDMRLLGLTNWDVTVVHVAPSQKNSLNNVRSRPVIRPSVPAPTRAGSA